jgi:hypothetical protein
LETSPAQPPLFSIDQFQNYGLLDSSGKPRLNCAVGYFRRNNENEDLDLLESLYAYWRDFNEFLVLRCLRVNPKTFSNDWQYVGVKCSKRGNDVYSLRIKKRLDWLGNCENVKFFDASDFTTNKKVLTSALWLTLTYDVKRCSRFEAQEKIGQEWNGLISALRRRYGRISVLRTWEDSLQGYPHIHAVCLFHDASFTVFQHLAENDKKEIGLQYRIVEKNEIASYWHSHVDVQAVSSTRKLFSYIRKYQTKTLLNSDSPKGVRTMALTWLFRQRSFSVSGDFRTRLHDLIELMHNSNMVEVQSRLDGSLEDRSVWEFVGVFSGSELGVRGNVWSVNLSSSQIETVLCREAQRSEFHGGYD